MIEMSGLTHQGSRESGGERSLAPNPNNQESFTPSASTTEGVLYLEQKPLPVYYEGIDSVQTIRRQDLDTPFGSWWERELTMSDGVKRRALLGVATHPVDDNVVASVPAWWVSVEKGFSKATSDKLHLLGRHTYTQGISINKATSTSRSAYDMHIALDHLATDGFAYYINTDEIDYHGDSNGGMTGAGVLAYSPEFGRTVAHAFLVDLCLVEKIGRDDFEKFLRHPSYIPKEVYSFLKQVTRIALHPQEKALDYAATAEFSQEYLTGNVLLIPSLASGETGHLLAHIPEKQKGVLYLFDHSIANQKKKMLRLIRGSSGLARQGIKEEIHRGTHLSIANPRTIAAKINYFAGIHHPDL